MRSACRRHGRPGGARPTDPPPPVLAPQPVCATIVGGLYTDDMILAVAHRFQAVTDFHAAARL